MQALARNKCAVCVCAVDSLFCWGTIHLEQSSVNQMLLAIHKQLPNDLIFPNSSHCPASLTAALHILLTWRTLSNNLFMWYSRYSKFSSSLSTKYIISSNSNNNVWSTSLVLWQLHTRAAFISILSTSSQCSENALLMNKLK